ncbi:MarR family winged helix-turn-helix transcriptional regulator [Dactylosporangium sp. CS-047395]|uniref:MarR family winged helix-turn-helix transcriptional regulator n=1 Tax=Dactylosporangium sp. CS-047395 TaxID=3239936 RepID=UPI003D8AF498
MTDELLEDPRITAMGLFVEAFTGVNARLNVQLAEHGLGNVDFEVLVRLARSPGGELRMTDLAAQTGLSTSGVTRVVDRLERDGLAGRRACPTDRRGSFTVISEAGLAKMREVLPGHVALIEQWFTGRLSPDELDSLLGSLRTVRDAVRPEATSGVPSMRTAA